MIWLTRIGNRRYAEAEPRVSPGPQPARDPSRARPVVLAPAALLLAFLTAGSARAQSLASPFGTVSQKVDSATITVEYYRPSVRGRVIFGRQVRWGVVWTPGANWATTLEVDRDVRLEGRPLPRGKYSLWMIPAERPDSWTVIVNRAARRFHVVKPDPAEDQLRFKVPADSGPQVEMLTFSFPIVHRSGATLAFQWAGTVVQMRLEVESSRAAIAAAHPWWSYTGTYELRPAGGDSTAPALRYDVIAREGGLRVRTTADAVEPGFDPEFDLLPAGGDDFHPRQYKNGRVVGDEPDELIVFHFDQGRATGFDVRGIAEDRVLARGSRVSEPRSPPGADTGHVAVEGGALYYERAGSGPAVVLLHGGNLDGRMWDDQFALLRRKYRVIRYDAKGFGRSTPADHPFAAHDDLAGLLRGLGVERASLVGLSLGGRIAIDFALANPGMVSCLVLAAPRISGGTWAAEADTSWLIRARAAVARGDTQGVATAWLGSPYIRTALEDSTLAPRLRQMVADNAPYWAGLVRHKDLEREASPPAAGRLGELRMPILLLVGGRDTPFIHDVAKAITATAPSVRRVDLPGVGHMINLEAWERFNAELTGFLARSCSSR